MNKYKTERHKEHIHRTLKVNNLDHPQWGNNSTFAFWRMFRTEPLTQMSMLPTLVTKIMTNYLTYKNIICYNTCKITDCGLEIEGVHISQWKVREKCAIVFFHNEIVTWPSRTLIRPFSLKKFLVPTTSLYRVCIVTFAQ